MSSLGPNASFILASYAAAAVILGGLTAAILRDRAMQRRALDLLEQRGAGRRPRP
jgi:heme exporter protein D